MQVLHQTDAGRDDVFGRSDRAGDVLVAGLGVVALMGDRADDVDAAHADQVGGAAFGQRGAEVVCDAVVLDDGAVAVGRSVQAFAVAVGRDVVTEQAGQDHAVAELAGWAEKDDLLAFGGWVPFAVGAGARGDPWEPAGGERSGFDLHARGLHLDGSDGAEADEVFDQTGEGGEVVHGADGGAINW